MHGPSPIRQGSALGRPVAPARPSAHGSGC